MHATRHGRPSHPGRKVLAFLSLTLVACAPSRAQSLQAPAPGTAPDTGTIQVTGQAEILVPADRVTVSFGVETESASAREASNLNASKMDAVISALRGTGIQDLEIETFGYTLVPEYRYPNREDPNRQTISGYRATNHIRVSNPDVDAAGPLLDAGIQAGANRVVDLRFEASDTREARLMALAQAVESAREEARTIADAMGVVLGPPLEVRGGASPGEPRVLAAPRMAMEAAVPSTPIEAGRQRVSANVTIVFRILENTP
jgi:hypothetical protein